MFCPALGIDEDPASGNAHAMLASYLVEMGQIGIHQSGFLGLQGGTCSGRRRFTCAWSATDPP